MGVTSSMLKNKIYLFDKWLSIGENVLYLLSLLIISVVMINFEVTLFYGIGLLSLICFYMVFIKMKINSKEWQLDKSLYKLPYIEEVIIVQRDFRYDLARVENSRNYINDKMIQIFSKGYEFEVISIEELNDDWIVELKFLHKSSKDLHIEVFWLDIHKYFMTISDVRDNKLNKLLK